MKELDANAARREYYRQWRAKNRDRVRAYNLRYWQRVAERQKSQKEGKNNDDTTKNGDR